MGAIAGPDSAAESELRKLLPESFFKYYGTFLRRLWREERLPPERAAMGSRDHRRDVRVHEARRSRRGWFDR